MMSDRGRSHSKGSGIAWAMGRAIAAVICAGVAMQLVGIAMFAIPGLTFDQLNPWALYPTYLVALVIIGIGTGITLAGARPVIKFMKTAAGVPGAWHDLDGSMESRDATGTAARAAAGTGVHVIRPALVKKDVGPTPSRPTAAAPSQRVAKPTNQAGAPAVGIAPGPSKEGGGVGVGPADMQAISAALDQISERYNKPDVRSKFDGWVNNLVMAFPDIGKAYVFKINGADGIEMVEGPDENAAVQVTMASDMFVKLLNKQINAIKAYSSGALKVKGEMKNLLKLRKLMF